MTATVVGACVRVAIETAIATVLSSILFTLASS